MARSKSQSPPNGDNGDGVNPSNSNDAGEKKHHHKRTMTRPGRVIKMKGKQTPRKKQSNLSSSGGNGRSKTQLRTLLESTDAFMSLVGLQLNSKTEEAVDFVPHNHDEDEVEHLIKAEKRVAQLSRTVDVVQQRNKVLKGRLRQMAIISGSAGSNEGLLHDDLNGVEHNPSLGTAWKEREEAEKFSDEQLEFQKNNYQYSESSISSDGIETARLGEDTFSFLISSRVFSTPFNTAMFIFLLKNTIYYLILVNLIDTQTKFNRIGIPVSVEAPVLFSQVVAFVISVFTQNDLIISMVLFYQGYSHNMKEVYGNRKNGGGRKRQWTASLCCMVLDGIFGMVLTFLLVVSSATVLDVLLNFAAVEFVSGLDEAGFLLSQLGFLGDANKEETEIVSEAEYEVSNKDTPFSKIFHTTGLVCVLVIVLGLWSYLGYKQLVGAYAARTIIVQFDDLIRPGLATHSGFYNLQTTITLDVSKRFSYTEERNGGGQFGYCMRKREWTFLIGSKDHCDYDKVLVRSDFTRSFDMMELGLMNWFVDKPESLHPVPMADFYLSIGCEEDEDCGGTIRGTCIRHKCVCKEGQFFGFRCEYDAQKTCNSVELDERFQKSFPALRQLPNTYTLLDRALNVYSRPVFINDNDVILFTGVRWTVAGQTQGFGFPSPNRDELIRVLSDKTWHADSLLSFDTVTDPVQYRTPDDKFSSPVGKNWLIVTNQNSLDETKIVEPADSVRLLCTVCSATNRCSFGNECNNGQCVCTNGARGILCQIPPRSDGKCDPYFNTPAFRFDGGDCCEKTCVDFGANRCGFRKEDGLPALQIGFPLCRDPLVVRGCNGKSRCHIPNSVSVPSYSTTLVFPTLSANGRVLVLAEPILDLVRVFDQVGSGWRQRGEILLGSTKSQFGLHGVALASPPPQVLERVSGLMPLLLAVVEKGSNSIETIRIFNWGISSLKWTSEPGISVQPGGTDSIDLGVTYNQDTGFALNTVLVRRTGGGPSLSVYQQNDVGWGLIEMANPNRVSSLSTDGTTLAVLDGEQIRLEYLLVEPGNPGSEGGGRRPPIFFPISSSPSIGIPNAQIAGVKIGGTWGTAKLTIVWSQPERVNTTTTYDVGIFNVDFATVSLDIIDSFSTNLNSLPIEPTFSNDGGTVMINELTRDGQTRSFVFAIDHYIRKWKTSEPVLSIGIFNETNVIGFENNNNNNNNNGNSDNNEDNGSNIDGEPQNETGTDRNKQGHIPVAISDNGMHIVDATNGALVTVMQLNTECDMTKDVTFHTSFILDGRPDAISWKLYAPPKGASCTNCYGRSASWSVVSNSVCMPMVSKDCFGFVLEGPVQTDLVGFAAYVFDENDIRAFASGNGKDDNGRIFATDPCAV